MKFLSASCATLLLLSICAEAAPSLTVDGAAGLWLPDLVSTPAAEVRITFSPDGQRMLWGVIGGSGGAGGWDIYESGRSAAGWSKPQSVSFNSSANDFDPSFAPDASGVYFFSNREGGQGKDDIYFAAFDKSTGRYDAAKNLGPEINTAADEWAPVVSPDGAQLLFASDGRGGKGKHDLFIARREGSAWVQARGVDALNTPAEDFDATFLHDGRSIVYSSGEMEGIVVLYVAVADKNGYQPRQRLTDAVNSTQPEAWTFGPSISLHERNVLYFTSHHAANRGRADIYRIRYDIR